MLKVIFLAESTPCRILTPSFCIALRDIFKVSLRLNSSTINERGERNAFCGDKKSNHKIKTTDLKDCEFLNGHITFEYSL